jgi:hypothetical protein
VFATGEMANLLQSEGLAGLFGTGLFKTEPLRVEVDYENARMLHNTTLTQWSEARDSAGSTGDVAAALAAIGDETESRQSDLVERIANARSRLSSGRLRLDRMGEVILEGQRIALLRAEVDSPAFHQRKIAAAQAVDRALQRNNATQALLAEARARLSAAQEADSLAASLSSLIEHGERLGLDHDHCPLCAAPRTVREFQDGLTHARARLEALGSGIAATRQEFVTAEQAAADSQQALASAECCFFFGQKSRTWCPSCECGDC